MPAWMLWLLAPVAVTTAVALGTWVRGRPGQPSRTPMAEHKAYLDALVEPARGQRRVTPAAASGAETLSGSDGIVPR